MDWADEDASSTKRTGSGFQLSRLRWSMEMEYLIVDLWEENIDDYYGPRKRTLVYKDIADRITAEGLEVSWTDVRNKIENLTRKYRQEKDKVTVNDGSPSQWPHFEKIHSLLNSDRKLVRPSQLPKAKKIKVEGQCKETFCLTAN
ncbi:hypothetical protein KR059_007003 [Drosophila kikkawai]|nr:hypothetical protein KR059_007003 [Drosophila kikkawai]